MISQVVVKFCKISSALGAHIFSYFLAIFVLKHVIKIFDKLQLY